ncbi:glycine-rich domain-containing protein [Massilia sp. GCM10020059]|uniref:Glycine-rich domain-containing protein-like n=2 Tax=Telluria group TaxID=2895353 RepID=A0ABS8IN66_9BURK|nr:glycine-rich domain-containing protein-like [Massilia agrisoli]
MISNIEMKAILDLDLTAIKRKLMHMESGEGWTVDQADAVEREYKRFLYLMKAFPTKETAPSVDVDTFWHYHILDTMKYAADCEQAFGYFLHHYPYVGMEGGADDAEVHEAAGERMREIYEETFGETYTREIVAGAGGTAGAPAYCSLVKPSADATAYCSLIAPASNAGSYCGGIKPPASAAAYCGGVKPPASAAAYCGGVKPPANDHAYCGGVKPPASDHAYCGGVKPPVSSLAYCGGVKPPASALAYCGGVKPPVAAAGAAASNADIYQVTQPLGTSLKAAAA